MVIMKLLAKINSVGMWFNFNHLHGWYK